VETATIITAVRNNKFIIALEKNPFQQKRGSSGEDNGDELNGPIDNSNIKENGGKGAGALAGGSSLNRVRY
jgi:hypothetical protein